MDRSRICQLKTEVCGLKFKFQTFGRKFKDNLSFPLVVKGWLEKKKITWVEH